MKALTAPAISRNNIPPAAGRGPWTVDRGPIEAVAQFHRLNCQLHPSPGSLLTLGRYTTESVADIEIGDVLGNAGECYPASHARV